MYKGHSSKIELCTMKNNYWSTLKEALVILGAMICRFEEYRNLLHWNRFTAEKSAIAGNNFVILFYSFKKLNQKVKSQ